MKTKQEVIQEAWGDFYEKAKHAINSDGWFERNKDRDLTLLTHFDVDDMRFSGLLIRPKVLDGIENNNGWTRIESEADLPKDDDKEYWIANENGIFGFVANGWQVVAKWKNGTCTHYQPIIKPESPIY